MKNLVIFLMAILTIFLIAYFNYFRFQNNFSLDIFQVIDDRFEYLDEKQMKTILQKTSKIMKEKFDTNINFNYKGKYIYSDFHTKYSKIDNRSEYSKYRFDIFDLENKTNMVDYIYYTYKDKYQIEELEEFIINKSMFIPDNDYKNIIVNLLIDHREKIEEIKDIILDDKTPLLKKENFEKNSFTNWKNMISNCAGDIIITNLLIIDDYYDIPPHSLIRGGVLFGFAPKSKAQYGATAVVSTFPVITRTEYFVKARGYYEGNEEPDMMAYMIVHELLHSLFKYGDHYSLDRCPLNPIRGMRIKEWYENLKTHRKIELSNKIN